MTNEQYQEGLSQASAELCTARVVMRREDSDAFDRAVKHLSRVLAIVRAVRDDIERR
jgi:hypothetical protein